MARRHDGRRRPKHRPAGERRTPRNAENLIMGRNCLREVLQHVPERLAKVLVAETRGETPADRQALIERVRSAGIALEFRTPEALTQLTGSDSHQSFVGIMRDRDFSDVRGFIDRAGERDHCAVLMLDTINDPHNLGAMIRSAECFGIDAVIWSHNRGTGLTPAAAKSSAGASELVDLFVVSNLVESIRRFQDAGFWVLGADVGPDAVAIDGYDFPRKCVIVMGSEGEGVRPLTAKAVDALVSIPMHGRIDSLNVSQATAVLLYSYRQFHERQGR